MIVVGGSPTMFGAPAICARAAFRTGSGLVRIAAAGEVMRPAILIEPSATGILLPSSAAEAVAAIDEADPQARAVLAVGPGLARQSETAELVLRLLRGPRTVVLDADGLNILAETGQPRPAQGTPAVLTPHPGEFRRLASPLGIDEDPTDPSTREDAATALANRHAAVVVLKGRRTVVADTDRVYVNQSGNVALATAGSGDVLTGVIASLIGQGMAPFDAAATGVHLHGLAADHWAATRGDAGMRASDLADALPAARRAMIAQGT